MADAAHLLVDCLAVEGCEYVFSVPGEETMDVLDALSDHPSVRHISNGFAAMGISLPGAIAAKLVHPDRKVVALCGDGGSS